MDRSRNFHHPFLVAAGERARARRHELGLSQEQVALRGGLTHFTQVGEIERGEVNAGILSFAKLALGLDTDLGTLLAGLPDPSRHTTDRL